MDFNVEHVLTFDRDKLDAQMKVALAAALKDSVGIVVADAKKYVAPFRKSGKLEDSIGGGVGKDLTGTVWCRKFYGRFYEFGSRHQRAKPFMRPALIGARSRIAALLRQAVVDAWNGNVASTDAPPAVTPPPPDAEPAKQAPVMSTPRKKTREEWKAYGHAKKHGLLKNDPARIGR
ncbi:MAG: hypothetical protein ABL904_17180 [Hyphomicrobiaceae bacterium]